MPHKIILSLEKVSNKLTDRLVLTYLIALIAGTVPFLIIMFYYNWDFSAFWAVGFLTTLTTISGTVMKFLGGLGLILTYAVGCAFILKKFSGSIKGKKAKARRLKLMLILGSFALAAYGVYTILTSVIKLPKLDILTYLLTIYGIVSLMLLVYLIPAIREKFVMVEQKKSLWQRIKGRFGNFKYSLWKGYQTRIRKDYGKVFAAEYDRYNTDLGDIRDQMSGVLLLPITIIYIGFLPLFGIAIVLWLRLFSQNKKSFQKVEKILLIVVIGGIMVLSIALFFILSILNPDPTRLIFFNVSYGSGLIFSVALFMYVLSKA